jgi:hypothetical protein
MLALYRTLAHCRKKDIKWIKRKMMDLTRLSNSKEIKKIPSKYRIIRAK